MRKQILFIFSFIIIFFSITFALDTTITPEQNGTQPFVRSMAGGQVHITWSRPHDTTNFHKILRVREIFYEVQFKKGTDTTWYQCFPGGVGAVTDSTSINDPMTFKIDADSFDTSNPNALEGDKKGPNYYGFGVKDWTDTTVTLDLNKHYLIHIHTKNPADGEDLFYYSTNIAQSNANNPNTYFYRIRSRVEDSYGNVEVSSWFPDSTGAEVRVDPIPQGGSTKVSFYSAYEPFGEEKKDSTVAVTFIFSPMKSSNGNGLVSVLPCYLLKREDNSYYYFYDKNDTNADELLNAFEYGIGGSGPDKYNTAGILHQVEDVFGTVRVDIDKDRHITIARLPIKGNVIGYFYSLNSSRPDEYISRISNFREMLFTNSSEDNLVNIKGNLAHELQHLIHYGYDPTEETWVNEGCSGLAKDVCGYFGETWKEVEGFSKKHGNEQLFPWDKNVEDRYGITALWAMFLQEKFGRESIKKYVADPAHGIEVFRPGGP